MSGILNRTRVDEIPVSRATEIYPDILNGNTFKWSVDSSWSTGGILLDETECDTWYQVDYIQLV